MHELSRRQILKLGLVSASMSFIPRSSVLYAQDPPQLLRTIPASGEQISAVGLGTYRRFDIGSDRDQLAAARDVLRMFVARGGTMVDSSPMYGNAERIVGELVTDLGVVDKIFFATKVWTRGLDAGKRQMEESFELMATPRIDLMQVHNLVDTRTQLDSIRTLVEQGRVRYVGITHYTSSAFDDMIDWMNKEKLDYVQFPYSIVSRQAERRLLPAAIDRGVATIAHRNFEQGALFRKVKGRPLPAWAAEFDCATWGNFFLKYVLSQPGITNVIPATRKLKHLSDNMNAGTGKLPDAGLRKKMISYFESL